MKRTNPMTDLALVAVFAALIAAVTMWMPGINVAGSTVPITLQTLAITLAAMVLGPWRGFLATLLWLVVGLAGLPVFARGASGLGVLKGASAGFLVGFPVYALLCGLLSYALLRRVLRAGRGTAGAAAGLALVAIACSAAIIYPFGIAGMMHNIHMPFSKAWKVNTAYFPGDLVKIVIASVVSVAVHKAFPMLALAGRTTPAVDDAPHRRA